MDINKRFGAKVAQTRRELGLSQEELADLAQIARSYCSDVERGARNPTLKSGERIAKALDTKFGDLLD